jgi:glutamate-1-semialdehyde 2,1-aminomutase
MGLVLPRDGFLNGLRSLTREAGALLLFDEVMTGFRAGPGGAQGRYGVTPDLTTLGKVVGGGLPVGAFGGRADIMELLAPAGPVYQAGTLSGNPLAMAAGLATLACLDAQSWARLEAASEHLCDILRRDAAEVGIDIQATAVGGMFGFFFADGPVRSWNDAATCDRERFGRFFHAMLREGVYLAPSPFEAGFVSTAHGEAELGRFEEASRAAMGALG